MTDITDADREELRDLTAGQIGHHRDALGEALMEALLANKSDWRCGYNPEHDEFWCVPSTADERWPRGVGGGPWTCKWGWAAFNALKRLKGPTYSADDAPMGMWVLALWDVWAIGTPESGPKMPSYREPATRDWWRASRDIGGMPIMEYMGSSKPVGWWPL
jgi:hypothetical protein